MVKKSKLWRAGEDPNSWHLPPEEFGQFGIPLTFPAIVKTGCVPNQHRVFRSKKCQSLGWFWNSLSLRNPPLGSFKIVFININHHWNHHHRYTLHFEWLKARHHIGEHAVVGLVQLRHQQVPCGGRLEPVGSMDILWGIPSKYGHTVDGRNPEPFIGNYW